MSNTSDDHKTNEEEEETISKYVPPKNIPISEIWNKDLEDPSLTKYKQQLIGNAINITIGIYFWH
jgi:hypothetical protein